jgi:hypothetical protein
VILTLCIGAAAQVARRLIRGGAVHEDESAS